MSRQELIDALNSDRADELAAIIQYMGHHYEAEGMEALPIMDMVRQIAIDEMRHAEMLAERIVMLGGTPTQTPSEIHRGGDLRKMMEDDLAAESRAIENYRKHIKLADQEGDTTTRRMLEEILADEEMHADQFRTVLGSK
ncbi:ferritin-like domain-containing protein [Methermicoccus shengliensis]|uniref:Ferritin n=1 Tax=Methermicoccus shengliensis TaxID=660064 RepID=A0A832RVI9_9EURY|nr:ferritin-like domain-containing protein [Methermicoccus shengliensis]KUK04667.1 MAG: Ferritin and Dps [Euryarchaeota archaeon 55_53]KUK30794.1 MAG: Ferritin and Dp [Methanosarcinales archeaon 56_1174]MDI3487939.1 bacterioferritin [Methanosarcinales archaeon]MDN5295077.1 bacterioferritin [Methanosarcinales archaeon]HIH69101.1 ferritin [Methermicoccus shengliensis]